MAFKKDIAEPETLDKTHLVNGLYSINNSDNLNQQGL
jgi:hypothetical protein